MAQKILRFLIRIILSIIARVEIIGAEDLPESGFVAAANHLGRLDSALIFYMFDRDDLILPIAEKYKHHPLFGPLGEALGGIWLDRFNPDIHAVREMMKRLRKGGVLFIAPEGTRSKTEVLQRGKPGVSFLANKAGVPVVPAALIGTEDRVVLDNLKHLRRSHIVVRAGKPFVLPPIAARERDQALQDETDEIMCRIGAMLPEKYRGVYADYPRLKELLKENDA
jgi:1-acyl-sn-glycerol-3-phosphate acyltransferase